MMHHSAEETARQLAQALQRITELEARVALMQTRQEILSDLSREYAFVISVGEDGSLSSEFLTATYADVTGFTPEEVDQLGWRALVHPDDLAAGDLLADRLVAQPIDIQSGYRIIDKSGSVRYLEAHHRSVWDDAAGRITHIYGVVHDVTDKELMIRHMIRSERELNALFENALDAILIVDDEWRYVSVNPAACHMFGIERDRFLQMNRRELQLLMRPDEQPIQTWEEFQAEGVAIGFVIYQHPDGRDRCIEYRAVANFIANRHVSMMRDVTVRRQMEKELERRVEERTRELGMANQQLQAMIQQRNNFVSEVSHELRTPITQLSLKLELMRRRGVIFDRGLTEIEALVANLVQMTNDILKLSRLDRARSDAGFSAVALNPIIERVAQVYAAQIEVQQLTLTLDLAPDLPDAWGDANHLSQLVTNLLVNAIKYTPAGSVTARTRFDPERQAVQMQIIDTGIGILPDDMPHLFDRFYRGKNADTEATAGVGLGLSIVAEIVNMHHGQIEIVSQVDAGSTFTVWLPVQRAH
jgi:PAS domain S-box-containing protein